MKGGDILFRNFGVVKEFGSCGNIRIGPLEDQGRIGKLGDILVTVPQALDHPRGLQIHENGQIVGGMGFAQGVAILMAD